MKKLMEICEMLWGPMTFFLIFDMFLIIGAVLGSNNLLTCISVGYFILVLIVTYFADKKERIDKEERKRKIDLEKMKL